MKAALSVVVAIVAVVFTVVFYGIDTAFYA